MELAPKKGRSETVGRKANGPEGSKNRSDGGWVASKISIFASKSCRFEKAPDSGIMIQKYNFYRIFLVGLVGVLTALASISEAGAYPSKTSTVQIHLNQSQASTPLTVSISQNQSELYHWQAGEEILIEAFVHRPNGEKKTFKDISKKEAWRVQLNQDKEGVLELEPHPSNYSGRLVILGNGKNLSGVLSGLSPNSGRELEKIYEYRFPDGTAIKVHFTDQILEQGRAKADFPKQVFNAAVNAYQTITEFSGFDSVGFSFASPDKSYAYDPDKTIDIFIGDSKSELSFQGYGFSADYFKNAPCFDIIPQPDSAYHAVILIPADYQDYIKSWEQMNPSPLGTRHLEADLQGTLIHEMLHVILFYYNKNLDYLNTVDDPEVPKNRKDWYVEGLARYFETFVGAKHDFYSQGFKETLPNKIRFSRGGSNYFMRYSDQPFTQLRYENAIFWRFIHTQYGLEAIEAFSKKLRDYPEGDFQKILEEITQTPMKELLQTYAASLLFKNFELKEEVRYLNEVAKTRLLYSQDNLYLVDGYGETKKLGTTSHTDWVGGWEGVRARFEDPSVAGDASKRSDVSGWATDFHEVEIADNITTLPWVGITNKHGVSKLYAQVIVVSKGGSKFWYEVKGVETSKTEGIDLQKQMALEGLDASSIQKIFVTITNSDLHTSADYSLQIKNPNKKNRLWFL